MNNTIGIVFYEEGNVKLLLYKDLQPLGDIIFKNKQILDTILEFISQSIYSPFLSFQIQNANTCVLKQIPKSITLKIKQAYADAKYITLIEENTVS